MWETTNTFNTHGHFLNVGIHINTVDKVKNINRILYAIATQIIEVVGIHTLFLVKKKKKLNFIFLDYFLIICFEINKIKQYN